MRYEDAMSFSGPTRTAICNKLVTGLGRGVNVAGRAFFDSEGGGGIGYIHYKGAKMDAMNTL